MTERIHLLRSSKARETAELGRRLTEAASRQGLEVVDLTGDSAPDSSKALRRAVETGLLQRLVVAGGDGLVHLAINGVAGHDVTLGLLPHGTGNDFARALDILEPDPEAALGPGRPVDALRVTGADGEERWVASVAVVGWPTRINARANRMTVPLGSAIYAVATLLELPGFARTPLTVDVDGSETLDLDSAMLAVGNTAYFGGGMLACPDARPDDGVLHLTSIEGVGRPGMLLHLAGRKGGTAHRPEVLRRSARSIEIATPELELWGDGEFVAMTPARLELAPGAMRVAVPAG